MPQTILLCTRGLALICFVLTYFLCLPLSAQTYYVSPDGNDDNSGLSLDEAWQTLRFALNEIDGGDTVLIADGVYRENDVRLINKIGTEEQPTLIKSINQWGAKIESTAQFNTALRVDTCEYAIIDGLEVYNPEQRPFLDWGAGIEVWYSNFVTVQNCYAHDCGCNGFSGRRGDYMTFRRNVSRGNAKTNPFNCSGMSIFQPILRDTEPGTHILLEENVCFENECRLPFVPGGFDVPTDGNGIILDDYNWTLDDEEGGGDLPLYTAETVVQNNLCFNNGGAGAKAFATNNAIFRHNTTAYNNYVIANFASRLGDLAAEFVTGRVEFYNNIALQTFDQRGAAFNYSTAGAGSTLDYHNNIIVGDETISGPVDSSGNLTVTADQQGYVGFRQIVPDDFEFSSVDDFRQFFALRPGSPAVDAGDEQYGLPTDLTGQPRPQGAAPDAGAFEGAETGVGPTPPNQVRNNLIAPAFGDITIDGTREDFYLDDLRPIDRLLEGSITDESDLSASWVATYDAANLYVLIQVNDANFSIDAADILDRDGIEIFIDADNSGGTSYDGENDFHYIFPLGSREFTERSFGATQGVETDVRTRIGSYVFEAAFPWSTLGISPTEGTTFGFDIHVNDNDRRSGGTRQARLGWQTRINDAAANPSRFGTVTITEAAPIPTVTRLSADSDITLDGRNDDAGWAEAEVLELSKYHERRITPGIGDLAATWSSVWTDLAIYFYVDVTDDNLRRASTNFNLADGVQIFLDLGYERSMEVDRNDFQLVVQPGRLNRIFDNYNHLTQGAQVVVLEKADGSGYTAEVRLPWFALGVTPNVGMFLGVDVLVVDDDEGGGSRDHVLTWFADTPSPEDDPSLLGRTRLGDAVSAIFNPAVAAPLTIYPNPSSGAFTLEAPTTENLTVEVLDINGRRVWTRTGVRSGEQLDLQQIPSGTYVVSAYGRQAVYRQALQLRR